MRTSIAAPGSTASQGLRAAAVFVILLSRGHPCCAFAVQPVRAHPHTRGTNHAAPDHDALASSAHTAALRGRDGPLLEGRRAGRACWPRMGEDEEEDSLTLDTVVYVSGFFLVIGLCDLVSPVFPNTPWSWFVVALVISCFYPFYSSIPDDGDDR